MAYTYKNITGSTAAVLLSSTDLKEGSIKRLSMTNIHATDPVLVDLYLYRTYSSAGFSDYAQDHQTLNTETYYLIKNFKIPFGSNVQFEQSDFLIDYKDPIYTLYIKLDQSDSAVDVIINT